jgi:predicted acylesterase/phospholipase RssA
MGISRRSWQTWLRVGFYAGFLIVLGADSVEAAKKNKEDAGQQSHKLKTRELTDEQLEDLIRQYREDVSSELARLEDSILRQMERDHERSQASGEPFVRDILILSGGGAKGAFGAGFLKGWGSIESGPMARPEFDVVTGVSTGALIAPFAFVGTAESYTTVAELYANSQENWIKKRGALYLLPSHVSLFNDRGLQTYVESKVDRNLVQAIALGAEQDRLLLVGATNLDLGVGRIFDLGAEARRASESESGSLERIHAMLLASSALPGIFPPVELDGFYYTDGGASAQIFVLSALDQVHHVLEKWREAHPDASLPRFRLWVIVNEPLKLDAQVTRPRWTSIAGRSLQTMMRASLMASLREIQRLAYEARIILGADVEFRYVSIPDDAPRKKTHELFEHDYMVQLEELGLKMGADPSSWRTQVPDIHWLSEF